MAYHKTPSRCLPAALALALSGCVVSGPGIEDAVDRGLVTGSVAPAAPGAAPPAADGLPYDPFAPDAMAPDQLSDRRTVRNAVSAADLARVDAPVSWANTETGATGTITAIAETRKGGRTCRAFTTTRQRFDGIALYSGEACTRGEGEWVLVSFAENG